MYRTYNLTEKEDGKIIKCRWDGDCYYYDVFEDQEEANKEELRLKQIEKSYKQEKERLYKIFAC